MVTLQNKVYYKSPLDFSVEDLPSRTDPRKIVMASPDYFDIVDVKNVHMEGEKALDKQKAGKQWGNLKRIYEEWKALGAIDEISILAGAEGCEDMVFAANQSFPWLMGGGEKVVAMSKMKHSSRQKEVPFFEKFYKDQEYKTFHLNNTDLFEGMGDTIPHPVKNLLYGGYGHRSDPSAYEELSVILNVPVIALKLINEKFYHLDTCFLPLDEKTVMLCKEAFTDEGLELVYSLFRKVIEIPLSEAEKGFALNAHIIHDSLSGHKLAVIHQGNDFTVAKLMENGFRVWELDTSEYMKSGGSVFCMKMMYY